MKEKTLYISDLDGTLLNNNGMLSEETAQKLNALIAKGVNFTVATARTDATVRHIMSAVDVNVPAVLMNGVVIFDLRKNEYVRVLTICENGLRKLIDITALFGNSGFMYCIEGGELTAYYVNLDPAPAKRFVNERKQRYDKSFCEVASFEECVAKKPVYFSVCDKKERLEKAAELLKQIDSLHVEFYHDTYNDGYWFLEVCSCEASKYSTVCALKDMYGFERVVGFGDNFNDLALFRACDEAYAVGNAVQAVRDAATAVIGTNTENGVANFIEQHV